MSNISAAKRNINCVHFKGLLFNISQNEKALKSYG